MPRDVKGKTIKQGDVVRIVGVLACPSWRPSRANV